MQQVEFTPKRLIQFWAKVDRANPDGCWPWLGYCEPAGYGKTKVQGKLCRAHRVAFAIAHGRWPIPQACHHCDNPPCVRPDHLFEGSQIDNLQDMRAKGRGAVPEPKRRLTVDDVRDIRRRYVRGSSHRPGNAHPLATEYGVSHWTIRDIVVGKKWTHV